MQWRFDLRAGKPRCATPGYAALLLAFGLCYHVRAEPVPAPPARLIVIGFMGGNVSAGNLTHREALVAKDLQQHNPKSVYAEVFANTLTSLANKDERIVAITAAMPNGTGSQKAASCSRAMRTRGPIIRAWPRRICSSTISSPITPSLRDACALKA